MTNEQIIFKERCRLLKEGKIRSSGKMMEVEDENGEIEQIPEPIQIHTYKVWKDCGFTVKKGEHAVAAFDIWKHGRRKKDNESEEILFKSKAFFFSADQVELQDLT